MHDVVAKLLADIRAGGEETVRGLCRKFDKWDGDVLVSAADVEAAVARVPDRVKRDIEFAHARIYAFAVAQRKSMRPVEVELVRSPLTPACCAMLPVPWQAAGADPAHALHAPPQEPGLSVGHQLLPVECAGCYVPGGRFAHIASALMTVATARAAGVDTIVAASPPRGASGIHPAVLYALHVAGADHILTLGGVQAVASLAFGLFTGKAADMLVGPGNRFVVEAKRQLSGEVGIDLIAGPTEIAILADSSADAEVVAVDLVSQAEHGPDSPAVLITDDARLAAAVHRRVPDLIAALPPASAAAEVAWRDYGEIVVVDSREEMAQVSDEVASEHLEVHCRDAEWWMRRLRNYGSLFVGEECTVAMGDKCSGPNHTLPTRCAARHTGGLSVCKFLKVVSWQRMTRDAMRTVGTVTARISRAEGMEAHARAADVRLKKYFDLEPEAGDVIAMSKL